MIVLTLGGFLLTKVRTGYKSAANTLAPLTDNRRSTSVMAINDFTFPQPGEQIPPTPELNQIPLSVQINLTQRNIDTLMAAIITQMEALATYMKELTALKQGASCD